MTQAEELAEFVVKSSYADLSEPAREQLKMRILDSLGCALGALAGPPVRVIRTQIEEFGGAGHCTLIGGGRSAPDRAAFLNAALVRYLDFNDSFLAAGETCHPSDNLGPVLSAAEYAQRTGRDFLTALAVAYQVQCRLSEAAPVRAEGFDHTTQGSFAVAAGVSKALGLDEERTANAVAICGTAFNALRVTRTGALSHWKGLAYANAAFGCTHAAFLAMRGITGPREVFEGNKGFMDSVAGKFEMDWRREGLEKVRETILKKYNAEVHSQSALEAALELRGENVFAAEDIALVELETFDVAFHIIGGGEEGNKKIVRTKEEADHSLPYMVAAALLDGRVMPDQYREERISSPDIQALLEKVMIRPVADFSWRFPQEMPCRLKLRLRDGRELVKEKADYEGFHSRPMSWKTLVQKFELLSAPFTEAALRRRIGETVYRLESLPLTDLTGLLAEVRLPQ